MMKKFLAGISLVLLAGLGYGADMGFVTVLSSPVGSFASLETASTSPVVVGDGTTSGKVNFCNTSSSSGTIMLQGNAGAKLGTVNLSSHSGLVGNMQAFQADNFVLQGDAWIEGKALVASTVNLAGITTTLPFFGSVTMLKAMDAQLRVAQTLHMPTGAMSVRGLRADKLYLTDSSGNNQGQLVTSKSAKGMQWTNEYNAMYDHTGAVTPGTQAYGGTSAQYRMQNQYLLKGRSKRLLPAALSRDAFFNIKEGACFAGAEIHGVQEVEIGGFCSEGLGGKPKG